MMDSTKLGFMVTSSLRFLIHEEGGGGRWREGRVSLLKCIRCVF
uniref:Alternative protein LMNB1 n=1 Tax=Homo sapiens TaxID=9606 RepID=L0R6K0_HUMAN|nr:alternative protein LMNB1 [Homo sapiens]